MSAEIPLKRHFLQLNTGESGKMVAEGDRHSLKTSYLEVYTWWPEENSSARKWTTKKTINKKNIEQQKENRIKKTIEQQKITEQQKNNKQKKLRTTKNLEQQKTIEQQKTTDNKKQ